VLKSLRTVWLLILITGVIAGAWPATAFAATDPGLGGAGPFAVLAGTTVTNTGPSVIAGELGVAPGSAVTGFPPGISGVQHRADAVATTAQTNLTAAYVNAAGQGCPGTNDMTGVNLGGGRILVPGVYCQTSSPPLTGVLTLNGAGVYIFQEGSTLITGSSASVVLINGALPCQVFWQVGSSATIATSTTFVGTIMALTSISMQTGATLSGRALARNGAVTLDTNVITQPAGCGFPAPVPSPTIVPTPIPTIAPTAAATAAPALPNTGGPPQQPDFPWWPLAIAGTIGAVFLGLRLRNHRRDS
jgi:hypothetical protein